MRFVRAIFALLIAWSVAMAPTIGVSAVVSLSSGHPLQAVPAPVHARHHVQQGQQPYHHNGGSAAAAGHQHHADVGTAGSCCHDGDGSSPSNAPTPDDCSTMPGCPLKSFSLAPAFGSNLAAPLTVSTRLAWHLSRVMLPSTLAPPLRPPRS